MIEVREIQVGGDLKEFLGVVDRIYAADPNYVRPLDMDVGDRLNPKKNPFFGACRMTLRGAPSILISARIIGWVEV